MAIKIAMGDDAYRVAVSSTKSMTGHLLGSGGALEACFCLLAMQNSTIPPTINLAEQDPECDLDYVPNVSRRQPVHTVLTNSFGFGGQNACLTIRRFKE